MAAPKGNQFWKARSSHGREKIFETSEILWNMCVEYFEWIDANPLMESKAFAYQGDIELKELPKMHAMTITGLCIFLDIDENTWRLYKDRNDFIQVTTQAESIIYQQKFSGAAAELLNPSIIARDLGLKDAKEHSGNVGLTDLSDDGLLKRLEELKAAKEKLESNESNKNIL